MELSPAFFNASLRDVFILAAALSADAFAACFAYGADRVRIPFLSGCILAGLSSAILFLFLLLGKAAGRFLPSGFSCALSFFLLFVLGLIKLFDGSAKALLRKLGRRARRLSLSVAGLHFIMTVYADPEAANGADEAVLSPREALSLGAALSLDGAAAGLGAGILCLPLPFTVLLSLAAGGAAVAGGTLLGNLAARKLKLNLSWLSGLLLIALAFSRL